MANIAVASDDGNLYLFGSDDSSPIWSYDGNRGFYTVAISGSGDYIIVADSVYARLFHKDSNTPVWTDDGGANSGRKVVDISADGETIIIAQSDSLQVHSNTNNTIIYNFDCGDYITSISISADGRFAVCGGYNDGQLSVFDLYLGTKIWDFETDFDSDIEDVAISSNGEYLVAVTGASGSGNYMYFFGIGSNQLIWSYEVDSNNCVVDISSDGSYVFKGGK